MKTEYKIIAASIIIGLFTWGMDAVIDYLFFYEGTLLGIMIFEVPNHELYIRLVVLGCFVLFGIFMSTVIKRSRRADEALRESEEIYKVLVESATDMIYMIDKKNKVLSVNKAAAGAFGKEPKKIIGKSIFELFPEEIATNYSKSLKKVFETGRSAVYESRMVIGERESWINVSLSPVRNHEGRVVSVMGVTRDFTEQKHADEALRFSDAAFRSIQESVIATDLEYTITHWNAVSERIYGIRASEAIGKKLFDVIEIVETYPGENVKRFKKLESQGYYKGEQFHKTKRANVWVIVSIQEIEDSGKRSGWVGLATDITERKRAEAICNVLFNISKATIKTSNLNDLLATIHEQIGILMDANNFFVCLAYDREKNLYTFPYYKDIHPEDLVEPDEIFEITEGLTHHVLKTKEYLLGNKEELNKIGVIGTVPESWLGVPLKTENGDVNGVVAVQSYEKEAYSEEDAQVLSIIGSNIGGFFKYKQAEEQLKASLKEKELLLREIHHRVKNNLQVISSLLNLQSSHIMGKKNLELFKESQNRIKSIAFIHEKLYQSKDLSRIDFKEYTESLVSSLFRSYGPSPDKIALKIEAEEVLLGIDSAIPCGLIINELVSNSLKHAFPDGKKGEIKICLHSSKKNDVELVVSDNGIGMPEDMDFRKAKSLGLHLVTILAEDQLHGQIRLNRKKGTKFQIKFSAVR